MPKSSDSIVLGNLIDSRLEQPQKTASPKNVTESGTSITLREEHPSKALLPIWVIEFGISIDISAEHSEKALSAIAVIEEGITMVFIVLSFIPKRVFLSSLSMRFGLIISIRYNLGNRNARVGNRYYKSSQLERSQPTGICPHGSTG